VVGWGHFAVDRMEHHACHTRYDAINSYSLLTTDQDCHTRFLGRVGALQALGDLGTRHATDHHPGPPFRILMPVLVLGAGLKLDAQGTLWALPRHASLHLPSATCNKGHGSAMVRWRQGQAPRGPAACATRRRRAWWGECGADGAAGVPELFSDARHCDGTRASRLDPFSPAPVEIFKGNLEGAMGDSDSDDDGPNVITNNTQL
jgi:hypothetical protein